MITCGFEAEKIVSHAIYPTVTPTLLTIPREGSVFGMRDLCVMAETLPRPLLLSLLTPHGLRTPSP